MNLIFVDCEGDGHASPATGRMTEFGAVYFPTKETFYGKDDSEETFKKFLAWINKVCGRGRAIFVSDNPAYDWQWINYGFDRFGIKNPFGHSARRIGDFAAGLQGDFTQTQDWKRWRKTPHDHNPVHDAMGNVEAFERLLEDSQHVRSFRWSERVSSS